MLFIIVCYSLLFKKNTCFKKFFQELYHSDIWSVLIWTVSNFKAYQHTTKVAASKERVMFNVVSFHPFTDVCMYIRFYGSKAILGRYYVSFMHT